PRAHTYIATAEDTQSLPMRRSARSPKLETPANHLTEARERAMFTHPDVTLDIARQRAEELIEIAAHERLVTHNARRGRHRRRAQRRARGSADSSCEIRDAGRRRSRVGPADGTENVSPVGRLCRVRARKAGRGVSPVMVGR